MDLSEFKPPVRLSMSDEEIYQALGAAQANEDGLARAMAIVEEQANLREHDNQLFAEWVARMQNSDAPEAKIALENIERAKQGLEPLPLVATSESTSVTQQPPIDDVVAALNAAHENSSQVNEEPDAEAEDEDEELPPSIFSQVPTAPEVESEPEPISIPEPVEPATAEVSEDDFDLLLAEAAGEATTSIRVSGDVAEPAVTFETDEPQAPEFAVSADEDALVEEERHVAHAKPASGWWANASYFVLTASVFMPVLAAYLVSAAGFSFATSVLGFGVGSLVILGLQVAAHFTAQRTDEAIVVASRASFGVIGAAVPAIAGFAFAVTAFALSTIGGVASFNGAFAGQPAFGSEPIAGVSITSMIQLSAVIVAFLVAGLAPKAIRWVTAFAATLLVIAFVVAGLVTRDQVNFDLAVYSINLDQVFLIAGLLSLLGIAMFGKAPKVAGLRAGRANTFARWSAVVGVLLVLPLLVFAHFVLAFSANQPSDGFSLLDPLGFALQTELTSPILWVVVFAILALLVNLARAVLESLRGFTLNLIHGWLSVVLAVAVSTVLWFLPDWATWLSIAQVLIVPVAAAVGFGVADALLRRGMYHEASLLRGYGFYGRFNVLAVLGYLASVAVGFALSAPTTVAPWLGFADVVTVFAPLASFALALVWVAASGVPRILNQQREVAEVELRKASLSEFPGFAE